MRLAITIQFVLGLVFAAWFVYLLYKIAVHVHAWPFN